MKNALMILLFLIALAMIVLGVKNAMLPPALTGVGFIVIAVLINQRK